MANILHKFIKYEASSGIILFIMAALALIIDNSAWQHLYQVIIKQPLFLKIGEYEISSRVDFLINDVLMVGFFFLVGLEIKREIVLGELKSVKKLMLPGVAALGGMLVPGLIFIAINWNGHHVLNGWAIPTATDIAFALGVLSLLGPRIPVSLKIFLTALAILDDLGAIIIIAVFYTENLALIYLLYSFIIILGFWLFNRWQVVKFAPYFLAGALLWYCIFRAGIHPTLAGVITAFFIPIRDNNKSTYQSLESSLHPWVAYLILPLFAFANAGISFTDIAFDNISWVLPLSIVLGLFLGKQLGIFTSCWLAIKFGLARLPAQATWLGLYGVSIVCGIGFTMSLFIGTLAFEGYPSHYMQLVRLGVLSGSLVSGVVGYFVLHRVGKLQ